MSGRLGSPALIHKGMPPIHFEKLSCTACHSGPFPTPDQTIVHTSLAHKLGLPAPARGKETAPIIIEPIFLRAENQLISPYKMVWPSYWAHLKDGKITPMLPAEAAKSATIPKQESDDIQRDPYNTKPLVSAQIQQILQSFPENPTNGQPVYIAVGKLFRLDHGQLISEENAAAKPYAWALAHDVRPASQALGARGCADCHSADSQVYFANVVARGPVDSTNALSKGIWEMRGDNKKVGSFFAFTFTFRPMLKIIVFAASFIVLAVLIHYGLRGVGAITAAPSRKTPP
jgi:hypothetical protein